MFDWDSLRASHSTNSDTGIHEIALANASGAVGYLRWDADDGEVTQLFVGEPYRRLGLATHMWELATDWARENGLAEPEHSSRRTEEGDRFASSIGGYIPRLTDDVDGWSSRQESVSIKLLRQLLHESAGLLDRLRRLRPEFARAAQMIYDAWQQDEDGFDDEVGAGGICDEIASEMAGILAMAGISTVEGGQDGDDHAYLYAYDDRDAFEVDLPHQLYERGSGYSWTKIPEVVFELDDIEITRVNREDILGE